MAAILSIKAIRQKIKSVKNIRKITKAMQMVSAAKLKKVQGRLLEVRPYADKIDEFLSGLVARTKDLDFPAFTERDEVKNIIVVTMMADKGLCGSFNSNMTKKLSSFITERDVNMHHIAVGKKTVDFMRKRSIDVEAEYLGVPTTVSFAEVRNMTRPWVSGFDSGAIDEVYILYTKFVNAITFEPSMYRLLPIQPEVDVQESGDVAQAEYIFEPSPEHILEQLVPRYIETTFHRILMEAMSSEHAARMNAMKNATDNAGELIDDLTLTYNKARQSSITTELLDIVGGAEALAG